MQFFKSSILVVMTLASIALAVPLNPQPLPPGIVARPDSVVERITLSDEGAGSNPVIKRNPFPLNPQPLPPGIVAHPETVVERITLSDDGAGSELGNNIIKRDPFPLNPQPLPPAVPDHEVDHV
jgi:hypothetical protein